MFYCKYKSPIGVITIASSDADEIIGLWIGRETFTGSDIYENMYEKESLPSLCMAREWLDEYFKGNNPSIDHLPIRLNGSEFRRSVWEVLREVPYGTTLSYSELAMRHLKRTGRDTLAHRAVGGAVANNPIAIIIPCHRIIGASGKIGGFAAGVDVKARLLMLEGSYLTSIKLSKKTYRKQLRKNYDFDVL